TALKIVETCCQQLKNYDEQFLVLEKNLELQEKHMNSTNNTSMLLFEDDDYDDIKPNQSQLSTITSNNEQLQQQHDTSMETNSTTMLYEQNSDESFNPEGFKTITSPPQID
ncbi:unnamed protein product, partial [Didymodactylos carnosus]